MTGVGKEVGCGPGNRGRARAQRYHAPEVLSWTSGMEELPCPEAGLVAPEVVTATEPPAPSLVDRYFTRWYKAGKCGMVVSSALPHRVDAAGTSATRWWAVCTAVVQSGRCLERDHMEPQEGPKKGSCDVQRAGTSLLHNLDFRFVFLKIICGSWRVMWWGPDCVAG